MRARGPRTTSRRRSGDPPRHGPNGADHPNENAFREIEPDARIALEHVVPPWFLLTVTLTPRGDRTLLSWRQQFESAGVAAKLQSVVVPANEQNLDRLEAELARAQG